MTYKDKLQDVRWQKKRLELLEGANWRCQHCGSDKNQLQVHHLWYFRFTDPWDYADSLYVVLCKDCHVERQEAETRLYSSIAIATRLMPGKRLDAIGASLIPQAFKEMDSK